MLIDPFSIPEAASQAEAAAAPSFLTVTCVIAGQAYGLPIGEVREVVSVPALLPLAGAPAYLPGLLNLRGQFIPVLDARSLVGMPARIAVTDQVIILGGAEPEFGLLVDVAQAVRLVSIAPSRATPRRAGAPILGSVVNSGDQAALLLDVDALRALLPDSSTVGVA